MALDADDGEACRGEQLRLGANLAAERLDLLLGVLDAAGRGATDAGNDGGERPSEPDEALLRGR